MNEPIRKIKLRNGKVRYRLVVDIGVDENGKRQQLTRTFDKQKEARDELARIRSELGKGTYVKPSEQTVNEYLDEYLAGATRGRRESTRVSYRDSFRCPRELFGHRPIQSITKTDIDGLVEYMVTTGRKRGGQAGTGLGPRSVQLTLSQLSTAFERAVLEGKLVRNPVKLVEPPEYTPSQRDTWGKDEVRRFLTWAAMDRLHAAWRLSLYGLRRGEVLGLRWSDIDLDAKKLTVNQARILVEYRMRVEEPKSRHGKRTLPLDDELVQALTKLRKQQALDRLQAGARYQEGLDELDWYTPGDSYVVTDELGMPVHPEWYTDEFTRLLRQAQLTRIRLHDSRHTTLSLMEKAGVPISVISRWAGHHDSAFTMRTYVHANDEDLELGAEQLAQLYKLQ